MTSGEFITSLVGYLTRCNETMKCVVESEGRTTVISSSGAVYQYQDGNSKFYLVPVVSSGKGGRKILSADVELLKN